MKHLIAIALMMTACGGSTKPATTTPPANTASEQTLPAAMTQLCAAPVRAKADPEWKDDSDAKMPILGKHMEQGITNAKVLQFLELAKGGGLHNTAELDALLTEAAMKPEQCELRAVFTPANA